MKYFDTQLGFVSSHVNHFLGGAPSRDLIVNMVMHDLYDLRMSNIAAMLMSVEETSSSMYMKILADRKIEEADLKRRYNALAMGIFVYKEIHHMVEYLSNDASISILRQKDVDALNEMLPPLEALIRTCIRSFNNESPIFATFIGNISDQSEFKWEDVEIDKDDTDFPIDPQKYLDVSDDFLEYYDDKIAKHYKPDSYMELVNQNIFLRECLIRKYDIPIIHTDGDK